MANQNPNGLSKESAIIFDNIESSSEGIDAEYGYLDQKYGKRGVDWKFNQQRLTNSEGKIFDEIDITLSSGNQMTIYFDITNFFGKDF